MVVPELALRLVEACGPASNVTIPACLNDDDDPGPYLGDQLLQKSIRGRHRKPDSEFELLSCRSYT